MEANCFIKWRNWLEASLSFFYPEVCQVCFRERATVREGFIGEICRQHVAFIQAPFCSRCGLPFDGEITTAFECSNCKEMELHFVHARSAVAAKGMVLDLIHRYKYQRALWLEPYLAGLLIQQASPCLCTEKWDWIVPVPLHPLKESEREFNQAERLSRRLSTATGIPARKDLLRRVTATRTQTQLSRSERASNVQRAFAFNKKNGAGLKSKRVVLVDDVLTTGATTSACAKVLRSQGASEVCVWTVARGLLR